MIIDEFQGIVSTLIHDLAEKQRDRLTEIAHAMAKTVAARHSLFAFGASHSGLLVQEIYYRAGGFMLLNPLWGPGMDLMTEPPFRTSDMEKLPGVARVILANSALTEGDLLLVVSTSGRNAVPVEMAEEAKRRGAQVVALTSLAYSRASESTAPSGKRLFEVADFVLDNGAPAGDAVLTIPGVAVPVASVSTITGAFLLQVLMAETIACLVEQGEPAPVFLSGNLPTGRAHNAETLARYGSLVHYPLP